MVDIDHFKRVNDHYGRSAGDRVLRHIVGVLRQRLRASDVLGRYGGEEFMVPVARHPPARRGATGRATAPSRASRALRMARPAHPIYGQHWRGRQRRHAGRPSRSSEALLQAADQALYRAKDDGRNPGRAGFNIFTIFRARGAECGVAIGCQAQTTDMARSYGEDLQRRRPPEAAPARPRGDYERVARPTVLPSQRRDARAARQTISRSAARGWVCR